MQQLMAQEKPVQQVMAPGQTAPAQAMATILPPLSPQQKKTPGPGPGPQTVTQQALQLAIGQALDEHNRAQELLELRLKDASTLKLNNAYYEEKYQIQADGRKFTTTEIELKASELEGSKPEWWAFGFEALIAGLLEPPAPAVDWLGKRVRMLRVKQDWESFMSSGDPKLRWCFVTKAGALLDFACTLAGEELLRAPLLHRRYEVSEAGDGDELEARFEFRSQLASELLIDACRQLKLPCKREYFPFEGIQLLASNLDSETLANPESLVHILGVVSEEALQLAAARGSIKRVILLPLPSVELVVELSDPSTARSFSEALSGDRARCSRSWTSAWLPNLARRQQQEKRWVFGCTERSSSSRCFSSSDRLFDENVSRVMKVFGSGLTECGKLLLYDPNKPPTYTDPLLDFFFISEARAGKANSRKRSEAREAEAASVQTPSLAEEELEDQRVIGHVPGQPVGSLYKLKAALVHHRVHWYASSGVSMAKARVNKANPDEVVMLADCIILNSKGSYKNEDRDTSVVYSGSGDGDKNQVLLRGNRALANSCRFNTAVRVVRHTGDKVYKFRYDGLFFVLRFWEERGGNEHGAYMFVLEKCAADPDPIPCI